MSNSPRIAMPYIVTSQSQKEVTHNEALNRLDAMVQTSAESFALSTPPESPADGSLYVPVATATGAWTGKENYIAQYIGGAWNFYAPFEGLCVFDKNTDLPQTYVGSAWTQVFETPSGAQSKVDTHVNDTTDAHEASAIKNTPAGNISATTVQAAINELDSEKAPKESPVFTGSMSASAPLQTISGTCTNELFNWATTTMASNLATGKNLISLIGQSTSLLNSGYIGFKYAGDASVDNLLSFGLFGVDNILNLNGYGNVGVGVTTPQARLDVRAHNPTDGVVSFFGDEGFGVAENGAKVGIGASGVGYWRYGMPAGQHAFVVEGWDSVTGTYVERAKFDGRAGIWGQSLFGSTVTGNSFGLYIKAGSNSSDSAMFLQRLDGSPILRVKGNGDTDQGEVGWIHSLSSQVDLPSPVSARHCFGTDGSGWQYRIAKNQLGVITDLITVTDAGNVGIGISNPECRMHIVSTDNYLSAAGGLVISKTADTTRRTVLGFDTDNNIGFLHALQAGIGYHDFVISPFGGNVGIGTTNPANGKLEVNTNGLNIVLGTLSTTNVGRLAIKSNTVNNRKLWLDGLDGLAFNVNGTEKATLNATGVGIGVPNPQATIHGTGNTILGVIDNAISPMADSSIGNSQCHVYIDQANNKLTFRVKNSNGVLQNFSISPS